MTNGEKYKKYTHSAKRTQRGKRSYLWMSEKVSLGSQPGPGALKAEYPRQTVGEGHSRHGNNMYNGMEHTQGIVFFFFLFVVDFVIH